MQQREIVVVAMYQTVFGLDRQTGEIVWESEIEGGGLGPPALAIAGDLVVVSTHASRIAAFDRHNGFSRWSAGTTSTGRATLLLDGDRIVVCKDGYLDCFDLAGKALWSQPLKGKGMGRAALGVPGNVVQADEIR